LIALAYRKHNLVSMDLLDLFKDVEQQEPISTEEKQQ